MKINANMIQSEAEAKLFFQWDGNEDPGDTLLTKVFEYKTFFITKAPVKKLFLARLNKLEKMVEAYHFLFKYEQLKSEPLSFDPINFTQEWYEDFNILQIERSRFKNLVFMEMETAALRSIIEAWMEMEDQYQQIFGAILEKEADDDIIASVEIDPMELLQELENERKKSPLSGIYLKNNAEQLPKLLKNELKRLNLLSKL